MAKNMRLKILEMQMIHYALRMSKDKYYEIMKENFNAYLFYNKFSNEVRFENKEDIENAFKWIESVMVCNELRGLS